MYQALLTPDCTSFGWSPCLPACVPISLSLVGVGFWASWGAISGIVFSWILGFLGINDQVEFYPSSLLIGISQWVLYPGLFVASAITISEWWWAMVIPSSSIIL